MLGVWIGAIQNMYPELGAGVEDHSILLREPLQRVARSVYPIMGVVYDGDRAAQTGEQIKGYHTTIKGVDAEGRRYHALNPETFYWAHATFFMLIIKTAEYFCGGLTEAEKRQLFDEHVQWYRMYGMSMRPVPETWEEFQEYWDRKCRDELEINRATLDIFTIRIPKPRFVLMPTPVWDQLFRPHGRRRSAGSPPDFSIPRCARRPACAGRPATRCCCGCSARLVEMAFSVVPDEIRLHPRALAAYRRASGRVRRRRPAGRGAGFMATTPRDRRDPAHARYSPPRKTLARTRRLTRAHHVLTGRSATGRGRRVRQ